MSLGPEGTRVLVTELGHDPEDAITHHLRLEPQPAPEADAVAPTDAVIAVHSAQVGWVDLLMTSGQYQHQPPVPYVPGLEAAGVVLFVGREARGLAVGDRVLVDGLRTGPRSLGTTQREGGFATYLVAPADALVPLPARLSFDQGACLLGNYETAYHALVTRARLAAGETVLILGASGATGLAAVHLAKKIGARVIATGRSEAKLAEVQAEGADHVLVTADEQGSLRSFKDEVKALTEGRGVEVVYDGVGGESSLEALRSIGFGGRYLVVGWAATPDVARGKGGRGAPNVNVLPTNLILMKGLDVLGSPAAIAAHRDPAMRAERLSAVLRWAEEGAITPKVGPSFALRDVREAMRAKWKSRHVGGVVLHPR